MSGYYTFETWDELIDYLKNVDCPKCFAVNYILEENNYALWIGNQPYYFYDELIHKLDNQILKLKTENVILKNKIINMK